MQCISPAEPGEGTQRFSRTDCKGPVASPETVAPHTDAGGDHSDLTRRFQREVLPLMGQLGRQARRMTRNHTDAEDLVQETMMRAYAGFHSYRQETNANAWLCQILHNTLISGYRKRQSRVVEVLLGDAFDWHLGSLATNWGAGQRAAEEEALDRLPDPQVKAAMEALPESFRKVVYYADVHGYRGPEIARITKCPSGTVTSRLARGRLRLRGLLIDHADGTRTLT